MRIGRMLPLAVIAMGLAASVAEAQEASSRVAICNPAKVFQDMDERKVVEDRMRQDREKIQAEITRRRSEAEEIKKLLISLNPNSAQYKEKMGDLQKKAIEFEVWARTTEQELVRAEKEQVKALFEKIRDGCKEVAEARQIDLVLTERKPDLVTEDQLTVAQFRTLISQVDVLFSNEKADITQAVIAAVNKKYAGGSAAPKP